MTSNEGRASTLARALHAGLAGDRRVIEELCTDDVQAWAPALSASSVTELLDALDRRDDGFTDLALDVVPLDAGGDFAAAEWSLSMTHTGSLTLAGGDVVAPTGIRVTVHGATVAEFRGDRICAVRQYWDELAMFEQLGLFSEERVAGQV
jgi:ketosteroid isomerase-like protein